MPPTRRKHKKRINAVELVWLTAVCFTVAVLTYTYTPGWLALPCIVAMIVLGFSYDAITRLKNYDDSNPDSSSNQSPPRT